MYWECVVEANVQKAIGNCVRPSNSGVIGLFWDHSGNTCLGAGWANWVVQVGPTLGNIIGKCFYLYKDINL